MKRTMLLTLMFLCILAIPFYAHAYDANAVVQSIVVEDVVITEGEYLSSPSVPDFHYDIRPNYMTVTFSDGTTVSGSYYDVCSSLDIQINCTSDQSENNLWKIGTHTAKLTLLGFEVEYTVEIVDSPVFQLLFIDMPDKLEYLAGEYFDFSGSTLRIQYRDGSYQDVVMDQPLLDYRVVYSEKLDIYDHIDPVGTLSAGQKTVEVQLFNKTCQIPVIVKENPMERITIKQNADRSLTISVYNADQTSYDLVVQDIYSYWMGGKLTTDKGIFDAPIYTEGEDSFSLGLWNGQNYIKSSSLPNSWLNWGRRINDICSLLSCEADGLFAGELAADNIDAAINIAGFMSDLWWDDSKILSENSEGYIYRGEDVRNALKEFFKIDNLTLNLSARYNAGTDTYFKPFWDGIAIRKFHPNRISHHNGIWTVEAIWHDSSLICTDVIPMTIKLDADGKILFYRKGEVQPGWVKIGSTWYYFQANGQPATGWLQDKGKWYYLDETGKMAYNTWRKDSIGWVYLGSDGAMLTNSWCTDSLGWCYVGADGYAVTNCWKRDSIGWIWLDGNGSMTKNSWVLDGGKWYWLDNDGYMVSNTWRKDSIGWVYLGSDGAMLTNTWCTDSLGWCYVGADGYAVTNCWKQDSFGWVYLNANGSMTKSDWVLSGGKWYWVNSNGYMVLNTSIRYNGKTYYFDNSGVCTNP